MKNKTPLYVFIMILVWVASGCRQEAPAPVSQAAGNEPTAATAPTLSPTETVTPLPTDTLTPTDMPAPTFTPTFTPSPTPEPLLIVLVIDETDEVPLAGSIVQVTNDDPDFQVEQAAGEDGTAVFAELVTGTSYTVTVKADGYLEKALTIDFAAGDNEVTVTLEAGYFVAVLADSGTLRSGPGTMYDAIGSVEAGEILEVVGRSDDSGWLVVLNAEGEEVWLAASLVDSEAVDLARVTAVAAPATPTPAPTRVAAAPPAPQPPPVAAPPAGNLLSDPSFEAGGAGWRVGRYDNTAPRVYVAADNPQFVHSGAKSVASVYGQPESIYYQNVFNVTPGQTYRAGVWVKIWSSSGEDRARSENPGDYSARLCIGPSNETDPNKGTAVCTGYVRPLDAWQYLTVDAIAETDTIAVILQSAPLGSNLPAHNEAIWDDVSLTIAPSAATPTPEPAGPPVRPAPIPFDAAALRDNMNNAQWVLEQMGGLLDRLVNGSTATCVEYEEYYRQLVGSAAYRDVPGDWQGVYNEYNFAVENGYNTNSGVFSLCEHGGGGLNPQAYGDARSGVNNSLDRLIPAINMANALLGG